MLELQFNNAFVISLKQNLHLRFMVFQSTLYFATGTLINIYFQLKFVQNNVTRWLDLIFFRNCKKIYTIWMLLVERLIFSNFYINAIAALVS